MDIITHTLISISTAGFIESIDKHTNTNRKIYYFVALVSGLFPDIDAIFGLFTKTRLQYLLLRRTYTHTIWALGIEFFILFFFLLVFKKKGHKFNLGILSLLAIVNLFLHCFLDYLNNYGILFLWPLSNKWLYGDTLFIIEPYIIGLLIITLSTNSKKFIISALGYLALFVLFGIYIFSDYSDLYSIIAIIIFFSLYWYILKKTSTLIRFSSLYVLSFVIIAIFFLSSNYTKSSISRINKFTDIIVTPMPANPFRSIILAIEIDKKNKDIYRVHKGSFNFIYNPSFSKKDVTCELEESTLQNTKNIRWIGKFEMSFKKLMELSNNCALKSYLNWSRVPFVIDKNFYLLAGDLRFDLTRGNDFAEIQFEINSTHCLLRSPNWHTPLKTAIEQLSPRDVSPNP